jgi:hypothetical protein
MKLNSRSCSTGTIRKMREAWPLLAANESFGARSIDCEYYCLLLRWGGLIDSNQRFGGTCRLLEMEAVVPPKRALMWSDIP